MERKKIVISGSTKLQKEIKKWQKIFESKNNEILDWPKFIEKDRFMELYPNIHKTFFENITKTDILFIMNEDKLEISGYIGAATFAELTFGVAQKLIYNKKIDIVILKMPSKDVACYEEISLWIALGWIKLYEEEK